MKPGHHSLKIGWAEVEITPRQWPVCLDGQFYVRVAETAKDSLWATVWALESGDENAIFISCDLLLIPSELLEEVRHRLGKDIPGGKLIINATHTHTGPMLKEAGPLAGSLPAEDGLPKAVVPDDYRIWLADRLATVITQAWNDRQPGGVAYGLDYAVVGRNRRWVNGGGESFMYLTPNAKESFLHVEGSEDSSLNLLAVYDADKKLTGLVVNLPCPAQKEENGWQISADFWHETRRELRRRFGSNLFILPQCSVAGDLSPHLLYEQKAHDRMVALRGRTVREDIAHRIADAVGRILPWLEPTINFSPTLRHAACLLDLPLNSLTRQDADEAAAAAATAQARYEREREKLAQNPDLRQQPQWWTEISKAWGLKEWNLRVVTRFDLQKTEKTLLAEVHVVRLGDVAFASNPFEYYLDYGQQIKVRTPAVQTFLVQLAGPGTYLPSLRSVQGGGYGSVPASNPVGPFGGQILADYTVKTLRNLFENNPDYN